MSRYIIVMFVLFVFGGCREENRVTTIDLNLGQCFVDSESEASTTPSGGVCQPALQKYIGGQEVVVCLVVDSDNNNQTCTGSWKPGGDIALKNCNSKAGVLEELNTKGD